MGIFSWLISTLTEWYVWMPIVGTLIYLTWRNNQEAEVIKDIDSVLLILEIPKANEKSELAAEQLFASLHGILRDKKELKFNGNVQEHLSFEIASVNGQIRFYVWTPRTLQSFVEGQIYSQYPTVQIHEADEDYVTHERDHSVVYTSEITLADTEYLPIKTFQSFEVDPLAGITGTLAKLESTGEELWVQVLVRPIHDNWHKSSDRWASRIRGGGGGGMGSFSWLGELFEALWKSPEPGSTSAPAPKELSEREKTRLTAAGEKATKLGYDVKIRLAYLGESNENAKLRMQAIVGTFKQYNSTNLNGFKVANASFKKEDLAKYRARLFLRRGFILNIEELASVFHLPHTNVETPNIVWASNKTAEPPAQLPTISGNDALDDQISAFGLTNFRGMNHQFGMLRGDRSRHVYIIGQTGAGKSGLLELFALSDVFHNQGYAIIDPHGDFAVNNLRFIPESRIKDVVYFNPADTAHPLGFNPLEVHDPNQKSNISSDVIGVLKRMFGESWGPRLEYILRYTILALLDRPETTMLDITRMLTDKKFRKETLDYCQDTVVLNFWKVEFASWNDKFIAEAVAPVLNKVGAFTANPVIRNIIGQPKSTFNIRQMMDEGKILVVNLSKGLIGEDNAGILGSFLVTKIQLAAMSRSDIPDIKDRRPFFLYVDEFQNFATDSFATILSEARKYGLNLTVANQYISQMNETVRDAVFGNVGTMITFRVSADDAPILAKQYEPNFEPIDLLQMHNRNFIINMVIKGEKSPAFSARTLELPPAQYDHSKEIIEYTREHYSRTREEVQKEIASNIQPPEHLAPKPKAPQSQAMKKQWPPNAQGTDITPQQAPNKPRFVVDPELNKDRELPTPITEAARKDAGKTPQIIEDEPKKRPKHSADNNQSIPTPTENISAPIESTPETSTETPSNSQQDQQPKKKRSRSRRRKKPTEGQEGAPTERQNIRTNDSQSSGRSPRPTQQPQTPREARIDVHGKNAPSDTETVVRLR